MNISRKRARFALVAGVCLLALGACAPDTVSNKQATGFNAYLDSLRTCRPLQVGSVDLSVYVDYDAMGNDQYLYFIDQTSKLYYNRISYSEISPVDDRVLRRRHVQRRELRLHVRQAAAGPPAGAARRTAALTLSARGAAMPRAAHRPSARRRAGMTRRRR